MSIVTRSVSKGKKDSQDDIQSQDLTEPDDGDGDSSAGTEHDEEEEKSSLQKLRGELQAMVTSTVRVSALRSKIGESRGATKNEEFSHTFL